MVFHVKNYYKSIENLVKYLQKMVFHVKNYYKSIEKYFCMAGVQCALRLFDSFNSETTKINYQFLIKERHVMNFNAKRHMYSSPLTSLAKKEGLIFPRVSTV